MLTPEDIQIISNVITNAIQPLRNDINDLKHEVSELKNTVAKLEDRVVTLERFVKIDSTGIENEINQAVFQHLPQRFPGFDIKPFTLKNIFNPIGNNQITELDGAYILVHKQEHTLSLPARRYLIIVEAKHHVDYTRINRKLEQMYILKEFLKAAKDVSLNSKRYTNKFKNSVKNYKLDTIDEIYLYIGGPTWENEMVKYVKSLNKVESISRVINSPRLQLHDINVEQFADVLEYMQDHIGTIVPKGTRYIINDLSVVTGGYKTTSVPMVILPNYMNKVYT
jgi:hypothetical protein